MSPALIALVWLQTAPLAGPATVVDAQTLEIGGQRVTLWGVRTPAEGRRCLYESSEYDCGAQTRYSLSRLVEDREVRCEPKGAGVARCEVRWSECFGLQCNDYWRDLARELVDQGEAVQDRSQSGGVYDEAEADARRARIGVWGDPEGGGWSR